MKKTKIQQASLLALMSCLPSGLYAESWKQFTGNGTFAIQYIGDIQQVKNHFLANPLALGGSDWADIAMKDSYQYTASAWNIKNEIDGNMSVRNTQGGKNSGDLIIFKSQIRTDNNANFTTYKNNQTFQIWYDEDAQSQDGSLVCAILSNYEPNRYWIPASTGKTLSFHIGTKENSDVFRLIPLYYHSELVTWMNKADSILNDQGKEYDDAKRSALTQKKENVSEHINALDNTEEAAQGMLQDLQNAFEEFRLSGKMAPIDDLSQLTPEERIQKTAIALSGTLDEEDYRIIRDEMINLKELDLSSTTITELPDKAFSGQATLATVKLPNTCTRIGKAAFISCVSLKDLILSNNLKDIDNLAFARSGIKQINIGAGVTHIGDYAFDGCASLETITVDAANMQYAAKDGVLYDKAMTRLIKCPAQKSGNLNLPETLKRIEAYACINCELLTGTLTLPQEVEYIGNHAFEFCHNLEGKLNIPAKTQYIGESAFWGCEKLQGDLEVPQNTTYLGNNAFGYLSQITKVSLPQNLKSLNKGLLYGCSKIKHIVSPTTTPPAVNSFAFYGVDKNHTFIEVPQEALAAYQAAEGWKDFQNYDAVFEGYNRLETNGKYYIQYIGKGDNYGKFLTFNPENGKKAVFASMDQASLWELDFFDVSSATSAVTGGKGTDIRFQQESNYLHINMNGECYTDVTAGYQINDNRTFAFWLDKKGELKDIKIAIQGNNTFWKADPSTNALAVESRKGNPIIEDFVFRVISVDDMDDAMKIDLLKQSINTDEDRAWLDNIVIGSETWQLPQEEKGKKEDMVKALDAFEALKESDETSYDAFKKLFDQNKELVDDTKEAIEAALTDPVEYDMPVGLCLQLINSTDNRTLMRSGSTQWQQYCTSFEDEGTKINIGSNDNGVPEEVIVSPATFINKWDETNKNYYLYEPVAKNALRLNDGFLSKSMPGSTDYNAKSKIAAYHITTDSLINIQGAEGGFMNGLYFSPNISTMESDEKTATVWKMRILKRIIENGEALTALNENWIPVEMFEGAQMTETNGKTLDVVYWHKNMQKDKWTAISLTGETTIFSAKDSEFKTPLQPDKDFTLMTFDGKEFKKVEKTDGQTIAKGSYVLRMNETQEIVCRIKQASFEEENMDTNLQLTGSGLAQNKDNIAAYTVNEEGTAFVYGDSKTIKPFEGLITFNGNAEDAKDIEIREGVPTGIENNSSAVSYTIQNHRVIVTGTDKYELRHISGVRVADKKAAQKPGCYILTLEGKSHVINL